ncbi:MAG: gluconate 2-dehydrogenase subunit 3 family protein [Bryobacteraceae bacterium]|nr:gluconate 2-dehydrogenase subunit 3 family protein [Bryobacteraceae bacterium]
MARSKTRRDALKVVGSLPVLPVLAAQHEHSSPPKSSGGKSAAYKPKAFPEEQYALLGVLVDLIIPRTDTPGAADAGVHAWIDRRSAADPQLRGEIANGLAWLDSEAKSKHGKPFVQVAEADQIAILTPISKEQQTIQGKFFLTVKNLTVDFYYSSREGLMQELGWNANTYLPEFKGCTHREHQV